MEPTISAAEIALALKRLDTHRRIQREGYYRHREQRLAYRKAQYQKKKAEKMKDAEVAVEGI